MQAYCVVISIISLLLSRCTCLLQKNIRKPCFDTSRRNIATQNSGDADLITPKTVTKEIMNYFTSSKEVADDIKFQKHLTSKRIRSHIDGMHIITILFQCARSRRQAKNVMPIKLMADKLESWNRTWSERDISTFVYGVRSLECLEPIEGSLLKLGASKISESISKMSSRAIGNALYGLQDITSDTIGAPELCTALATKVLDSEGDLSGQDIGIGK